MKRRPLSILNRIGIGSELDFFIENLTTLSASGVDMISALKSLKNEFRTRRMKQVMDRVSEDVSSGIPLWRALSSLGVFSDSALFLLRSGEENSRLSQNLQVLHLQREKELDFRSRLRSAMMYPMFVIIVMMVVGIVVAWFVLPKLTTVFQNLRVELPPLTQMLLKLGEFLKEYGSIFVPASLGVLVLLFYFIFFFPYTRFIGQAFLFLVPGIKNLMKEIEISRFTYILGQLLSAGVPIVHALDYLPESTPLFRYRKFYRYLRTAISEGNSFQKSFFRYKKTQRLLPFSVQQIIFTAEQVGDLPKSLIRIAKDYDLKVDHTAKNLASILEPILLLLVWFGVLLIALAIIMPIYGLLNGV